MSSTYNKSCHLDASLPDCSLPEPPQSQTTGMLQSLSQEEEESGLLSWPSGDQKAAPMQVEKLSDLTHKKFTGLGKPESRGIKHRFGAPTPLFSYYTNPKRGEMPTTAQEFLHFR